MKTKKPQNPVDEFLSRLVSQHPQLSKQLQVIGTYIEQHRDLVGLEKIQGIANHCGVQPSAVVRFAKHFGFSGFTEMQALFRAGLSTQIAPNRSYQNRIREALAQRSQPLDSAAIADELVVGAMAGLEEVRRALPSMPLTQAVELLAHASSLWVVGARRAYPVAAYLAYALQHTNKPIQHINFTGASQSGQLRALRADDVMVAVGFAPYSDETIAAVREAKKAHVKVIAITDSLTGKLAQAADVPLIVQESSVFGFRALSSTMALAQCLFIALAYRLEIEYQPAGTTPL